MVVAKSLGLRTKPLLEATLQVPCKMDKVKLRQQKLSGIMIAMTLFHKVLLIDQHRVQEQS